MLEGRGIGKETHRYKGPWQEEQGDKSNDPHGYGLLFGLMSDVVHVPRTFLHVHGRELRLLSDELHVATGLVCLDRQHLASLHVFVLQDSK